MRRYLVRRRQHDGVGLDLVFGIVAKAWRSPPHVGALLGVCLAKAFCVALPAALSLTIQTQGGPDSFNNIVSSAIKPLVELLSQISIWFGLGISVACFGCAAINLVRRKVGQGDAPADYFDDSVCSQGPPDAI